VFARPEDRAKLLAALFRSTGGRANPDLNEGRNMYSTFALGQAARQYRATCERRPARRRAPSLTGPPRGVQLDEVVANPGSTTTGTDANHRDSSEQSGGDAAAERGHERDPGLRIGSEP
jgi:hypothetical protein